MKGALRGYVWLFAEVAETVSVWQQTAKYVPALVAFGLLTLGILFWMHKLIQNMTESISTRDKAFLEHEDKRLAALEKIGDKCHEHSNSRETELIAALDRSNKINEKNILVLGKVLGRLGDE